MHEWTIRRACRRSSPKDRDSRCPDKPVRKLLGVGAGLPRAPSPRHRTQLAHILFPGCGGRLQVFPVGPRGTRRLPSTLRRAGVASRPSALELDLLWAHGCFVFVLRNVNKYSFRVEKEMKMIILIPTLCGCCEDRMG